MTMISTKQKKKKPKQTRPHSPDMNIIAANTHDVTCVEYCEKRMINCSVYIELSSSWN